MKLATFERKGQQRIGVVLDEETALLDLAATHQAVADAVSPWFADLLALIDGGAEALALARTYLAPSPAAVVYPLTDVRLLAPLPEPRQIRDCLVFEEHLKNAFARAEKLTGRTYAIPPVRSAVAVTRCLLSCILFFFLADASHEQGTDQ